jgi:hypothetical protein
MAKLAFIALVALGLASPAAAQIAPVSEAQQRAANRQALRDARRTESPYKDSHLNVTAENLKRGSTEGPPGAGQLPASTSGRPNSKRPLFGRRRTELKPKP